MASSENSAWHKENKRRLDALAPVVVQEFLAGRYIKDMAIEYRVALTTLRRMIKNGTTPEQQREVRRMNRTEGNLNRRNKCP